MSGRIYYWKEAIVNDRLSCPFCSPTSGSIGINISQSNEKNRNGRLGDDNDDDEGSSKDVRANDFLLPHGQKLIPLSFPLYLSPCARRPVRRT